MELTDTILFDWDGTLVDTAQQAFDAFQKALCCLGIPLDFEIYERIYSPNWYRMYEELDLSRGKWKEADALWIAHYAAEKSRLMPGGEAGLNELSNRNYALGIVTSGTRARVLGEIEALGLAKTFQVVVCSEDVANKKPHPEGLELAMRRMGKEAEACCYVGDSADDIEMGRGARVITVGIPSRYPASRKIRDARPDCFFESLEQFVAAMTAASIPVTR
jgi:HAD superfamily hydrolase (TIGR01509 family)